jgi:menaquinone-dependent protoporphyrinogen oxidase
MPGNILVTYATRYGSTREVAEEIASTLREGGFGVDIQPAREVRTLAGYRAVVLGAALYMFRWHKDAIHFLSRHRKALMEIPVAVFILGPTHQPHDDNEWRDSRAQYDKELAKYPWFTPVAVEMFGGKFDPQSLRFPINLLAGQEPASDIRDWTAICAWASSLVKIL